MNYSRPDLLDKLASEYVLGTLRGRARRRFERLLAMHPAFRVAVQVWEERLGRLALSVPPVAPRAQVWQSIERRIGGAAVAGAGARKGGWFASFWKPALGFAFGVVATVGLVTQMPGSFVKLNDLAEKQQALPASYVGLLLDKDGQPTVLVSSTRHGTKVTVKWLRPVEVPAGKVAQVWALPKEGAAFPIGVATATKPPGKTSFEMSGSSEKLLASATRLAISFEDAPVPQGARPPAEFALSGFCVKLW
jgi:anti-sigma-K factor RskA